MSKVPDYIKSKPWLTKYGGNATPDVKVPNKPLFSVLEEGAEKYKDFPAVYFFGKKISYLEIKDLAWRLASGLKDKLGMEKGDVVGVLLPNCPQFVIALFGVLKAGGAVLPINPLYTVREIKYIVKASKAKFLVSLDIFEDKVENLEREISEKEQKLSVIYTCLTEFLPPFKGFLGKLFRKVPTRKVKHGRNIYFFNELLKNKPTPVFLKNNPKEDVALLLFTGGTTGTPKGVLLTHYNVLANVIQINKWVLPPLIEKKESTVLVLPIFHSFGCIQLLTALYSGISVVLLPKFETKEVLEKLSKYKAALFAGVPTIYNLLANYGKVQKYNLKKLKVCICAADVLPSEVQRKFEEMTGSIIVEGYGLTEAGPAVCINPPWKELRKPSTAGVPLPGTTVAIADPEENKFLELGEVGEILVHGPQVMKGYLNDPERNNEALVEINGKIWLRTGDIGKLDDEGFLYIMERKKDMIKYKGYSVFPKEIENVIYSHPSVKEACVVGVPTETVGQIIKAYVVLKEGAKATEKDIIDWCKVRLAPFKVPKKVEFRKQLKKNMVGKILRRVLREEAARKMRGGEGLK